MLLWLQRQLFYLPDASPLPPAGEVIVWGRDVSLHAEDGLELGAWFVPAAPGAGPTGRDRMAVLVAPGNGGAGPIGPVSPRSCGGAGSPCS
jgi:hypothetical protein